MTLETGKGNGLVAGRALCSNDWMPFDDSVNGIALLPVGNENSSVIQGLKKIVIGIGAIHDDDCIRRQIQSATHG